MQKINVVVTGCELLLSLEELCEFQGDLKEISSENADKLKRAITEYGFCAPFFVWENDGKYNLLDGHQRKIALTSLKSDGWTIPKLPAVEITGADYDEARARLLAISSQYGEFNVDTASRWAEELGNDILGNLRIVDTEITFKLDLDFGEFGIDDEDNSENAPSTKVCPSCGHEW